MEGGLAKTRLARKRPKPGRRPRPQPHPKDGIPKKHGQNRRVRKPIFKPVPQFDPWRNLLSTVPALADAIVWNAPGPGSTVIGVPAGTPIPYSQWTPAQQNALKTAWTKVVKGTAPPL